MKSAFISGDLGDCIYAMPAVRALGITHLYLNVNPKYKYRKIGETKFNERGALALMPLLESQPYIDKVELYEGQRVDYNLDLFRAYGDLTYTNLCSIFLKTFGCSPEEMKKQSS